MWENSKQWSNAIDAYMNARKDALPPDELEEVSQSVPLPQCRDILCQMRGCPQAKAGERSEALVNITKDFVGIKRGFVNQKKSFVLYVDRGGQRSAKSFSSGPHPQGTKAEPSGKSRTPVLDLSLYVYFLPVKLRLRLMAISTYIGMTNCRFSS